jgi:hypothetical protein
MFLSWARIRLRPSRQRRLNQRLVELVLEQESDKNWRVIGGFVAKGKLVASDGNFRRVTSPEKVGQQVHC